MRKEEKTMADKKTYISRFSDRKSAKAFAEKNDAVVQRCPATGANIDGYFKFQVVTEKPPIR